MREADALVVNGLGFEEGLVDTIEAAADDGVPVITATDAIDPIPFGDGDDPHLFTDPARMRAAAALIADQLGEAIPALATADGEARVTSYLDSLDALDQEVEDLVATVPVDDRLLVTNHDVFGYFADRYDFEVVGAVIPGGSTLAEPSAAELADLVREIDERGVPAVFAETSSPTRWRRPSPPRARTWRWWSSTASPSASRARRAAPTSAWSARTPSASSRRWPGRRRG